MRSALREQAELLAWGGDLANDRRRACGGRGLNGPTASTTRANAGSTRTTCAAAASTPRWLFMCSPGTNGSGRIRTVDSPVARR
jgi:hypothetical protein